ncbi:non-homologous end joining protein Ku [Streptomyces xantholiticus]|uniref:non-homologous end joining protein Ku n=1 Tax=Streptomyces xantholiticus TaxID=68285 RepID=UPI00167806DA|nr:Ku protein [Streptomyces xantholiticus]GGW73757.1 non-homologous end joining protein Ku [Streptomyces xantholiticus]
MPRPIWSGAISFGLVTIPIKVVPATENHSISFRQVHLEDGGRIRYRKVCELDGKQLTDDEIVKGYEVAKDTLVAITDEDLADMPLPTAKAIEIVAFVPAESIDPVRIGDSYYLEGDGQVAVKPYKLLRQALQRSSKVAVAKFALRGRERLGLLRVKEDALVLHSMHWPDEIRSPQSLAPPPVEIDDSEVDGALALMDAMGEEDISHYTDHYREALEEVIAAKAEGKQPAPAPEAPEKGGQIVDLMAALNASVAQARESRGEDEHATVHEMPKPKKTAKKTPAKKTVAKKTAAKKTAAKKTTARRKPRAS